MKSFWYSALAIVLVITGLALFLDVLHQTPAEGLILSFLILLLIKP